MHLHFVPSDEDRALYIARRDLFGFPYIEKYDRGLLYQQAVCLISRDFFDFSPGLFK